MSYTPLDRSFLTSTLLKEGAMVVACWTLVLAAADKNGESDMQPSAAASLLRVSDEETEKAFEVLYAPDPKSRNEECQGRRILRLDNGHWQVVSHGKYQALASKAMAHARQKKYDQNKRVRERGLSDGEGICEFRGCYDKSSGQVEGKYVCTKHAFEKIEEEPND